MEFPEVYLERISYVDLKALFEKMRSSGEYEEKLLRVSAAEYVDYNCQRDGYLWYKGDDYVDEFAEYVDVHFLEVVDIYDEAYRGWGVIEGYEYGFAMPLDGEISYILDKRYSASKIIEW